MGRECENAPGPFNFAVVITAEWLVANEHIRLQFLAAAPIHTPRASRAAESPKLSPRGAAPRRRANFSGVVADKQCTCPASKLMWERYPPTPPIFNCGKLDQSTERSLINFFRWV